MTDIRYLNDGSFNVPDVDVGWSVPGGGGGTAVAQPPRRRAERRVADPADGFGFQDDGTFSPGHMHRDDVVRHDSTNPSCCGGCGMGWGCAPSIMDSDTMCCDTYEIGDGRRSLVAHGVGPADELIVLARQTLDKYFKLVASRGAPAIEVRYSAPSQAIDRVVKNIADRHPALAPQIMMAQEKLDGSYGELLDNITDGQVQELVDQLRAIGWNNRSPGHGLSMRDAGHLAVIIDKDKFSFNMGNTFDCTPYVGGELANDARELEAPMDRNTAPVTISRGHDGKVRVTQDGKEVLCLGTCRNPQLVCETSAIGRTAFCDCNPRPKPKPAPSRRPSTEPSAEDVVLVIIAIIIIIIWIYKEWQGLEPAWG